MRLLVVEEGKELVGALRAGLVRAGYAVDVACDVPSAYERLRAGAYDLVLLDLDLPGADGLLLRGATGPVPSILMTAREPHGHDDCLAKPVVLPVLLARVRSALGRGAPALEAAVLQAGALRIDTARKKATLGGRSLALTPKEYGVLRYLMAHQGHVVSSGELLEHVWDEHADPLTNTVRVTVGTLRRKLREGGLIETVVCRGYRLRELS
jgi:DNA-binding response OmpR family regulator